MTDNLQLPFECFDITKENLNSNDKDGITNIKDFLGAFICTGGYTEVNIDEKNYKVSKGDIYFVTPTIFVHANYISPDFKGMVIRVDYYFITPIINNVLDISNQLNLRDNPCLSLTVHQYDRMCSMFKSLKDRIESKENENITGHRRIVMRELIKSIGNTIAYEMINIYLSSNPVPPTKQDQTDIIVQKFIMNVYRGYQKHREVSYYANLICITPTYLSGLIKKKTGKTALQWIIDLVISDAKQMLQYSNSSIKEIAAHLNFPSQSFFGKYFKQYVGMSPKFYRKKMKA